MLVRLLKFLANKLDLKLEGVGDIWTATSFVNEAFFDKTIQLSN